MSDLNEEINIEKDVFTEDAKIIIDIESIVARYGSSRDLNLQIHSKERDFISFSFIFSSILFNEINLNFIKKFVKEIGYEYLHFLLYSNKKNEPIYLYIRMRVSSKKRKFINLLKWMYYLPKRIYWRYKYWRNYGTWRYR